MYITLIVKICMTTIIIVISGDNEEADETAATVNSSNLEDLQLEEQPDGVCGDGNNNASVEECTGEYCIFFLPVFVQFLMYLHDFLCTYFLCIYTISYACPLCRGGSGSFPLEGGGV